MTCNRSLVVVSDNRLFAEAAGTALVSEDVISSYVHLRHGQNWARVRSPAAGQSAVEPLIVLLDVDTRVSGPELHASIRRLVQQLPSCQIVAMGEGLPPSCIVGCIESGASAFVLACDPLHELVDTIKALHDGQSRCSAAVMDVVLRRVRELAGAKRDDCGMPDDPLTEREVEVLKLVEQGLLNKEIASRLGIAISTVKNHLHSVFDKLRVDGRRQAVRQGIAAGILTQDTDRYVA
jgi:DNA-binding NarL/FixJ family response regulator